MKRFLTFLAWMAAFYLLIFVYQSATILDSWLPSVAIVLLIFVGMGAYIPAPAPSEQTPRETQIARYLLSLILGSVGLSIGLFLWIHLPAQAVESELPWNLFHGRWVAIYAAIGAGFALPRLADYQWGQHFLDNPLLRGLVVTLVSLLCFGVLAEVIMRTDLMRYEILGAYPYEAVAEHRQTRQQWGITDSDFESPKPAGVFRVVLVGDSFAYGYSVFEDERFAHYLQELAPENVEVIVLAYSGASTANQLTLWNSQAEILEADLVIVTVVANDADMRLILPQENTRSHLFTAVFPKSQFAYFLDTLNIPKRLRGDTELLERGAWEQLLYTDPETQAEWVPLVAAFQQSIVAQGADAWAYILTEPFNKEDEALSERWAGIYAQIESTYQNAGFHTVNTLGPYLERFGGRNYKELCALPNDCHPAPELHRFFAEMMWAELEKWLAEKKPPL